MDEEKRQTFAKEQRRFSRDFRRISIHELSEKDALNLEPSRKFIVEFYRDQIGEGKPVSKHVEGMLIKGESSFCDPTFITACAFLFLWLNIGSLRNQTV
jgi:hypothetical protein